MRSASISASSRSWVTRTTGIDRRRRMRGQLAVQLLPGRLSTAENGSSSSSDLGLARERARDRHALLLAAGELRGPPLLQPGEMDQLEQLPRRALGPLPRRQMTERGGRRCRARSGAGTAHSSGTRGQRPPMRWPALDRRPSCRARSRHRRPTRPASAADRARRCVRRMVDLPLPDGPDQRQHLARRAGEGRGERDRRVLSQIDRRPAPTSAEPAADAAREAIGRARSPAARSRAAARTCGRRPRRRRPAPGRRWRSRSSWSRPGCCRRPSARCRTRRACARSSAPWRSGCRARRAAARCATAPARATCRSRRRPRAPRAGSPRIRAASAGSRTAD